MVSSIFRHRTIFVLAAMLCSIISSAKPSVRTSVAVVTDSITYSHASTAIDEYLSSMQIDGKRGILIIDRWGVPDSLRAALKNLYENESLEGAVLVGDEPGTSAKMTAMSPRIVCSNIPVPMLKQESQYNFSSKGAA